jgi:hypothetical protein
MYTPGLGFQVFDNGNDGLPPLYRIGRQLRLSNALGRNDLFLQAPHRSGLELPINQDTDLHKRDHFRQCLLGERRELVLHLPVAHVQRFLH